jgi:hypothetical protein
MRMRRKSTRDESVEEQGPTDGGDRERGPWDASEVELDEEDSSRVHLGSLAIKGRAGIEVRLQADQATQQIQAVMLVAEDGAMELRPFAAPRNETIWDDIRGRLGAEAARRGGTADEVDGPYGTALQMVLPAVAPDGKQGTQTSTVLGVEGPRWLLRVSTFGRPTTKFDPDGLLEQVLGDVVVIRGTQPMSPGEALPLTLPAGARRAPSPTDPPS